jgi:hypothetical protein
MGKHSEPVKQGKVVVGRKGKGGKAAPAAASKAFAAAAAAAVAATATGMQLVLQHKFAARKRFDFANRVQGFQQVGLYKLNPVDP